jgi:hypothetical protein
VVECQLPKLDVAGSSPVARSPQQIRFILPSASVHLAQVTVLTASVVACWLAPAPCGG